MTKAGEGGASGESTLTVEEETSEFGFSSRRHNSGDDSANGFDGTVDFSSSRI